MRKLDSRLVQIGFTVPLLCLQRGLPAKSSLTASQVRLGDIEQNSLVSRQIVNVERHCFVVRWGDIRSLRRLSRREVRLTVEFGAFSIRSVNLVQQRFEAIQLKRPRQCDTDAPFRPSCSVNISLCW